MLGEHAAARLLYDNKARRQGEASRVKRFGGVTLSKKIKWWEFSKLEAASGLTLEAGVDQPQFPTHLPNSKLENVQVFPVGSLSH